MKLFAAGRTGVPISADGLVVQLIWEGVLLVIAAVLVVVALASAHGAHLTAIFDPVAYTGLVAAGLAFSLRTGTPNLAVGSIAAATGVLGAHLVSADGWSLWAAMAVAVLLATVTGLIAGLLVAALSVPAWAMSLAVAVLAQALASGISNGQPIPLRTGGSYPLTLWLIVLAVISLGGGALWLLPAVRTTLSATRNAGEPGQWAGLPAGLGAVVGLTGSSLLAGLGGVALATFLEVADPNAGGINLTLTALAAVLIGGVSVFGRRAGVAGTVLGVIIVESGIFILIVHDFSAFWVLALIGVLIVLGLGVSRALESITDATSGRRGAG
jgi:ribose/xylose/arabinose/galactoside ABC-type transport system permease subunit